MKKVDFTIAGTRLPVIPKGTKIRVNSDADYKHEFINDLTDKITDHYTNGDICIRLFNKEARIPYYSNNYIPLSTIEALAEEQGMLYEAETERDWTGVRFKIDGIDNPKVYYLSKEGIGNYIVNGFSVYSTFTQLEVETAFLKGHWIEVKEELNPIISQPAPSLRDLLEDACSHERNIRKGCPMFSGVDENERLEQVKQEWSKLREMVAVLHNRLNEKK
jgi:hypothetical protein